MGSVSWKWLNWWACFLGTPVGNKEDMIFIFLLPSMIFFYIYFIMYSPASVTVFIFTEHLMNACTYLVWQNFLQSFSTQPTSLQLLPGLLCGLTPHKSLSLGQKVCYQDLRSYSTHINQSQCNMCKLQWVKQQRSQFGVFVFYTIRSTISLSYICVTLWRNIDYVAEFVFFFVICVSPHSSIQLCVDTHISHILKNSTVAFIFSERLQKDVILQSKLKGLTCPVINVQQCQNLFIPCGVSCPWWDVVIELESGSQQAPYVFLWWKQLEMHQTSWRAKSDHILYFIYLTAVILKALSFKLMTPF